MMHYPDELLRHVLTECRVIAVVGFSMNPARPSHGVAQFLHARGYRVIPVNPGHAGAVIFGETVRASLSDIPDAVDMVDIFRRPEHVGPVVTEALAQFPALKCIWMQLGITNPQAAEEAEARGVTVIQDRCPKIDHPRVMG